MRLHLTLVALAALSGCAAGREVEPWVRPVPTEIVRTPMLDTGETMSGQPIALPQGPVALVVTRTDMPGGGAIPLHRHPWPRYVYIEKGWIEMVNRDADISRAYGPGDVIVEPVGQWHEGRALSDPVSMIAFDQAPPGANNMVFKEAD